MSPESCDLQFSIHQASQEGIRIQTKYHPKPTAKDLFALRILAASRLHLRQFGNPVPGNPCVDKALVQ